MNSPEKLLKRTTSFDNKSVLTICDRIAESNEIMHLNLVSYLSNNDSLLDL
jgi:hypothetical protein